MKKFSAVFFFLTLPLLIQAQIIGPVNNNFNSIRQNGVSSIAAIGDTVWVSPSLNRNIDNQADWFTPQNADSVVNGVGRVFSYALGQDTVMAGLGFTSDIIEGSVPAAYGYYISTDGGENWLYSDFLIDPRGDGDTTFVYGGQEYARIRITVPEQSPPYNIDFKGDVIFAAHWASGLLRSTDFGQSWERIVLPPSNVAELNPHSEYFWSTCVQRAENGSCSEAVNKYNAVEDNNLLGFSILIDSQNRVWFGSAAGVNVSHNALTAPIDSISWKHIRFNNSSNGLTGDWIISIEEEPGTGRIWMTNWIASDQRERNSIVYTDDEGETFTQMLVGEAHINDLAFKDGHIFAAGDNGLFISPDGGDTWIKSPPIKSSNTFIKPSAQYFSAAATTDRIWIGSSDGVASHACCTENQLFNKWEITRVDFPLSGGNVFDSDARSVKSYAYPNPFSASVYELVRIKFETHNESEIRVRIFDFGMNLVRELESDNLSAGTYEAVWDGYDEKGRKVANAPYIYIIESGNEKISGKILVVD